MLSGQLARKFEIARQIRYPAHIIFFDKKEVNLLQPLFNQAISRRAFDEKLVSNIHCTDFSVPQAKTVVGNQCVNVVFFYNRFYLMVFRCNTEQNFWYLL